MRGKVTQRAKRRAGREPCADSQQALASPAAALTESVTTSTGTHSTTIAATSSCSAVDVTCVPTVASQSSSSLPSATNPKPWLAAGAKPYYLDERAGISIFLGDCREILPTLGKFDLLLTDPPYGINHPTNYGARGRGVNARAKDYAPVIGDDARFDPSHLLGSGPAILWGANHFADALPKSSAWLVWDKRVQQGKGVNDQADGELAWSSNTKGVRIFRHMWNGYWRDSERGSHLHPTQKPVSLMSWCLGFFPEAKTVVDPYMGSGPVAKACKDRGLKYVGIELVEKYCEIAAKRLEQEVLLT